MSDERKVMTKEEEAAALKEFLRCWKMHGGRVKGEESEEERDPEPENPPKIPPVS